MNDWIETAGLISLWLAAILQAPAAARQPYQRPLWLGTCLIAVTTTLYQEPVIGTLGRLIGDVNVIDLSRHVSHTVTAAVMLYCVLVAVGRQRHIRLLTPAAAATIWLNLSAAPHARSTITTPELPLIYWLLCFGFYPLLWILFPAYLITQAAHPSPRCARSAPAGRPSARRSSSCSVWPAFTPGRCPPSSLPITPRRSDDTHSRHHAGPFPGREGRLRGQLL